MRRWLIALGIILAIGLSACSACPFCDTETRPDSDALALKEAEETLDQLSAEVFEGARFEDSVWEAPGSCSTAPFAPEQGEIGRALVRTYSGDTLESIGANPDSLDESFGMFWTDLGETVGPASPDSPRGSVARVNGIGYDIVVEGEPVVLRAFTPCY